MSKRLFNMRTRSSMSKYRLTLRCGVGVSARCEESEWKAKGRNHAAWTQQSTRGGHTPPVEWLKLFRLPEELGGVEDIGVQVDGVSLEENTAGEACHLIDTELTSAACRTVPWTRGSAHTR